MFDGVPVPWALLCIVGTIMSIGILVAACLGVGFGQLPPDPPDKP